MCYPKPGPRCPEEAIKRIRRAKKEGDPQKIREAVIEYYQTTEGIAKLRKAGREELADRMAFKRKARIALYKKMKDNKVNKISTGDVFRSIPLKEMDSAALTITLMNEVSKTQEPEAVAKILKSMQIATHLHIGQYRKNREGMPVTPYIEHPLRNTIRLHRMGCHDADTLSATLLHDTVEDCPDKIIRSYCGEEPERMSLEEKREMCYMWMSASVSPKTTSIVRNVTNPPTPKGMPKVEKHALYRQHVEESVAKNAETFLTKFSDFNDNASSLRYNNTSENKGMVSNMVLKYTPLVAVFRYYGKHYNDRNELPLSNEGKKELSRKLDSIEKSLGILMLEHHPGR